MDKNTKKWRRIIKEAYGRDGGVSAFDMWMGEFTDTMIMTNAKHIREICDIIVNEYEGTPEQREVYSRVKAIFESHAGGLMRDLQTFAFQDLGLDDPLGE